MILWDRDSYAGGFLQWQAAHGGAAAPSPQPSEWSLMMPGMFSWQAASGAPPAGAARKLYIGLILDMGRGMNP